MNAGTAMVSPRYTQTHTARSTQTEKTPAYNALRHGRYAETLVLPGEDRAEFQRQRLALYHDYRPQTEDEAECVEVMAENRWLRRRYLPLQARFDAQWQAPECDAAGRLCEPEGHARLHSSMDVTLHRQRVERAWHRARTQLLLLQKQRRLGLIPGAAKLPPGCYKDASGAIHGPVTHTPLAPRPEHSPASAREEVRAGVPDVAPAPPRQEVTANGADSAPWFAGDEFSGGVSGSPSAQGREEGGEGVPRHVPAPPQPLHPAGESDFMRNGRKRRRPRRRRARLTGTPARDQGATVSLAPQRLRWWEPGANAPATDDTAPGASSAAPRPARTTGVPPPDALQSESLVDLAALPGYDSTFATR